MKIYIAGPMTGLPELNFPAFRTEAARLRACGHEVVSPVEINEGLAHEGWATCMRRDLPMLLTCDAIQLLRGYEWSRGARLELYVAREMGLAIYHPACTLSRLEVAA